MLLIAVAYMTMSAQTKPCWVQKEIKTMNSSNKSYGFRTFATYSVDINQQEADTAGM